MSYASLSAASAMFLWIVCWEGVLVAILRFRQNKNIYAPSLSASDSPEHVREFRRALLFWCAALLFFEGMHDMIRTLWWITNAERWPHAISSVASIGECIAVVGLVRTFTRSACGEIGWVLVCVAPTLAAMYVLAIK